MNKLLKLSLFSAVMFTACQTTDEDNLTPQTNDYIDITVLGVNENAKTKVFYEPNDDKSIFNVGWNSNDAISLFVPTTMFNDNHKFVAASSANSSDFLGKIAPWEGEKTLYGIYPYAINGYTYNQETATISFDATNQVVDASEINRFTNGLMVATVNGSTVEADGKYNIPQLNFKQVMSFFQLELTDIPDEERVVEIGFEASDIGFVSSADVNLSDGSFTATSESSNKISATVANQTGATAMLNLALLPTDMSGKELTFYITTNSDVKRKRYIRSYADGLNFIRNTFHYSSTGAQSLINDFTLVDDNGLNLSNFSDTSFPEEDTWVIIDQTAITSDFVGLKNALNAAGKLGRTNIALEFPYLQAIPNEALKDIDSFVSVSMPYATNIGKSAFYSCANLESVSAPRVKYVWDYAFSESNMLASVSLPNATYIGDYAFNGNYFQSPNALNSISLPNAIEIGNSAFSSSGLVSFELPKAEIVGKNAFSHCINLISALLPEAKEIDFEVFYNCPALKSVDLPRVIELKTDYNTRVFGVFENCYSLTSVSIPMVTCIEYKSFRNCTALTYISAPNVKIIETDAFASCTNLKEVLFPAVTQIGASTFYGCKALEEISLPLLANVGNSAFAECYLLKRVSLPSAVSIGSNVFENCQFLSSLELATAVEAVIKSLGANIFTYNDTISNASNVTLTTGSANNDLVEENILTVDSQAYGFKRVLMIGGSGSDASANIENANGIGW